MARPRLRQDSIHSERGAIDDSLDPTQHDANAVNLANTLSYLCSQVLRILGSSSSKWFDVPVVTLSALAEREIKSGVLIPGDFSGTPKRATVAFATAYPSADYAVTLAVETINGKIYAPGVTSKTAAGFDVDLGSGNLANLDRVGWHAIANGET